MASRVNLGAVEQKVHTNTALERAQEAVLVVDRNDGGWAQVLDAPSLFGDCS